MFLKASLITVQRSQMLHRPWISVGGMRLKIFPTVSQQAPLCSCSQSPNMCSSITYIVLSGCGGGTSDSRASPTARSHAPFPRSLPRRGCNFALVCLDGSRHPFYESSKCPPREKRSPTFRFLPPSISVFGPRTGKRARRWGSL